MPVLIAAVVLLGALCLLNLLLTFGIVRKLRARGDRHFDAAVDDLVLPTGSAVPDFAAVTAAGERVTRDGLGETLFGFFSPDCGACKERLPTFVAVAAKANGRSVLAVLHGDADETREQAAALAGVAHVVVEPEDGPLGLGLAVTGYPVFGLIAADGTLTATGLDPGKLPLGRALSV
ncbi:TlpA family protein disulfide reductase [Streptomyces sp. SID3343]|uniref:TlpA family protein disulfide reductase n=1 Tax=Streptomyces sp. SID3343 TaxID=2690260 RepID=UPI00136DBAF1|nr:TlpA family protein disulfide reductase [Streptomyces sp. SID3343]MYV99291.1 TlpA family protein disulfide reductase [Streptomyces sp. SID3343]